MNRNLKRIAAVVCLITMFSCMSVSAAWEFAGYDTTNPHEYGKIFNEVLNGNYTSKQKVEALDESQVEWKFEGYEAAYPHVGYERLYLEGNPQKAITRTVALYPQWETRFKDFMWEVCGDHQIYQRQQTKINNKYWAWDFGNEELGISDATVFVPTNRYAETVDSFAPVGVANFDKEGNFVFESNGNIYYEDYIQCSECAAVLDCEHKMYNEYLWTIYNGPFADAMPTPIKVIYDEEGNPTKNVVATETVVIDGIEQEIPYLLHEDVLSLIDENGEYVVSDEDIAEFIDIPTTKYVTGPSYYGENGTKDVAAMYVENKNEGWYWDADTATVENNATISWTTPMYEMDEPYFYYQYLVVNGLVFDGRNDTPEIFRRTGGKAEPKIEWRYHETNNWWPYEVVQVKWMENNDGTMIPAVDKNGELIVRYPTGEFANSYVVVTDTHIELWIKDNYNNQPIVLIPRNEGDFGDEFEGFTGGAAHIK